MSLRFITGSQNKFCEVQAVLPDIEQLDIDLPEIQSTDPYEIIRAKLDEAVTRHSGALFVEDTSLYFDCLRGLPGPLIKWFLKDLGNEGIFDLVRRYDNHSAQAKTVIGYYDGVSTEYHFFEGVVTGTLVAPRVGSSFGWEPIFQPEGYTVTYAQMSRNEKNAISMRRLAVDKFKDFLNL